jgi:hypothetical protein
LSGYDIALLCVVAAAIVVYAWFFWGDQWPSE